MYRVWSVLAAGQLLASEDESKGHEFWAAGIYCTPVLATAWSYARPQVPCFMSVIIYVGVMSILLRILIS